MNHPSLPLRPGLTYAAVATAAEAITAEGGRPTLRGIRERLGTGSLGTIQQHLNTWRGEAPTSIPSPALPESFTKALAAEFERQRQEARAELAAELAEAREEIAALTEENQRQSEALEELNQQLNEAREAAIRQRAHTEALQHQLRAALDERATTEAETAELRESLATARTRAEQIHELTEEKKQAETRANREQTLREEAERRAGQAQERATLIQQQNEELKQELAERRATEKRFHEADKLNAILSARLEMIGHEITQAREERAIAIQQMKEQKQHADQLRGQVQALLNTRQPKAPPTATDTESTIIDLSESRTITHKEKIYRYNNETERQIQVQIEPGIWQAVKPGKPAEEIARKLDKLPPTPENTDAQP